MKNMRSDFQHLEDVALHIGYVQTHTQRLGKLLISSGEKLMGRRLIVNGMCHDSDKFLGIQWKYMRKGADPDDPKLRLAVESHNSTNPHHPEYWPSIKAMPPVSVAEMVCDWLARSAECGGSVKEWIDKEATQRFDFDKSDLVYDQISYFCNCLLDGKMDRVSPLDEAREMRENAFTEQETDGDLEEEMISSEDDIEI
jgi:hypothetical protein